MVQVRAMTSADLPRVLALWKGMPGIGLSDSDRLEALKCFLARNPGMSAVAEAGADLLGAVLCGSDGRRGYLHHLAVQEAHRRQGIGQKLLEHCFTALLGQDIPKCNIFVYADNTAGQAFWHHQGWFAREDILLMQRYVG